MPPSTDDEMIARALQEEYDREQSEQQQQRKKSSRRSSQRSTQQRTSSSRRSNNNNSSNLQPSAPPEDIVRGTSDEEYARRLAREEAQLYQYARQRSSTTTTTSNNNNNRTTTTTVVTVPPPMETAPPLDNTFDDLVKRTPSHDTSQESSSIWEDQEYARRLEQELRDEEVARQMQAADERRASRSEARRIVSEPQPRYSFKCVCSYILCFTIAGAAAVAFFYYFYVKDNDGPRWIWDPEDFADEDPFDAKGPEDITPWRTRGNGLQLEVVNALDPEWHEFFYAAILDWDDGYPDALSLGTDVSNPDPACRRIDGKVKVCNGNYGATSWKGINEIQIDGSGYIFASTSRMNDYYFNGNEGSMQYTMCHELGHAWGLPHTDETFGNADLGDCMDYTHNEDENKRPDIKNYDFLYRLYGLVPGAESYDPPTAAPTFEPLPTFSPIEDVGDGSSQQIESGPGGRLLKEWDDDVMEASILDARQRIMSEEKIGVRVLHQSSRGELHEADLAYGHRLRIEKLFPNEDDF